MNNFYDHQRFGDEDHQQQQDEEDIRSGLNLDDLPSISAAAASNHQYFQRRQTADDTNPTNAMMDNDEEDEGDEEYLQQEDGDINQQVLPVQMSSSSSSRHNKRHHAVVDNRHHAVVDLLLTATEAETDHQEPTAGNDGHHVREEVGEPLVEGEDMSGGDSSGVHSDVETILGGGRTFGTFEEFEDVFADYQSETGWIFYRRDLRTVEKSNERAKVKRVAKPGIKYSYVTYDCIMARNKQHIFNDNRGPCPATVRISCSPDCQSLYARRIEAFHNHCADDYQRLRGAKLSFTRETDMKQPNAMANKQYQQQQHQPRQSSSFPSGQINKLPRRSAEITASTSRPSSSSTHPQHHHHQTSNNPHQTLHTSSNHRFQHHQHHHPRGQSLSDNSNNNNNNPSSPTSTAVETIPLFPRAIELITEAQAVQSISSVSLHNNRNRDIFNSSTTTSGSGNKKRKRSTFNSIMATPINNDDEDDDDNNVDKSPFLHDLIHQQRRRHPPNHLSSSSNTNAHHHRRRREINDPTAAAEAHEDNGGDDQLPVGRASLDDLDGDDADFGEEVASAGTVAAANHGMSTATSYPNFQFEFDENDDEEEEELITNDQQQQSATSSSPPPSSFRGGNNRGENAAAIIKTGADIFMPAADGGHQTTTGESGSNRLSSAPQNGKGNGNSLTQSNGRRNPSIPVANTVTNEIVVNNGGDNRQKDSCRYRRRADTDDNKTENGQNSSASTNDLLRKGLTILGNLNRMLAETGSGDLLLDRVSMLEELESAWNTTVTASSSSPP